MIDKICIEKIQRDDGFYGPIQVCKSNAGWYLGRIFYSNEGYNEPGSRESNYFASKELAESALQSKDFAYRDAPENIFLYESM